MLSSGGDSDADNLSVIMLLGVRRVFQETGQSFLPKGKSEGGFRPTVEILEGLNADKEAPWADWKHGLTAEKLGRTLRSHGVKSARSRQDTGQRRGYFFKDLKPVFDSYLPDLDPENEPHPGSPSADQPPEPPGAEPGPEYNPAQSQDENSTRLRANDCKEGAYDGVSQDEHENKGNGLEEGVSDTDGNRGSGSDNSRNYQKSGPESASLSPGEAQTIALATKLFNATSCAAAGEQQFEFASLNQNPAKPKDFPRKDQRPTPAKDDPVLERMLAALIPTDYEGGLTEEVWIEKSGIPKAIFLRKLSGLTRHGGPVYRSTLNGCFQLSPRFAEKLSRELKE
jgi:hypothetical protein